MVTKAPPNKRKPRPLNAVCEDIAEALVAFANADGGELIVGIEDVGTVTGLDYSEEQIEDLLSAPETHVHKGTPLPTTHSVVAEVDGKPVLFFSVAKGTNHIFSTAAGRCLQRKDRNTLPIPPEDISFSRNEIKSREYDRNFVDGADLADLDMDLVSHVASSISSGMDPEKCLQYLNLVDFDGTRFRIRKAALLLFAKNLAKWHPRSQVRILKISGTEIQSGESYNVEYDETVSGNILNLLEKSWDALRPYLTETRFSKDALFKTQIIYPELACREAVVNAIAHRDYNIEGVGIEIHVYSDRMKIVSPGALLSTIRVEDLRKLEGVHESRNSLISRVLREVGYMRELGEGIRRIYELMSSNDLIEPNLFSDSNSFNITLYQKFVYSKEEELWLENFADLNLSREQRTVVRLGYDGRLISANDIWDAVGIVDTDYYRQLVESLRDIGILTTELTSDEVYKIARKKRASNKTVPRFSISIPSPTVKVDASGRVILDPSDYSKVFVANLPGSVSEHNLARMLSIYGVVENVQIPKGPGQANKGYAFVEFAKKAAAESAINNSRGIAIQGQRLVIHEYRPRRRNIPKKMST